MPSTLDEIYSDLCKPFPPEAVELLPGSLTSDKKRALAVPFADLRAYQNRLDSVAGAGNWSVSYRPWGDSAVICTLTILGISREDVGEEKQSDPNCHTSAVAQAFKRTCSSFGLGRYLYELPGVWAEMDSSGKRLLNPEQIVRDMYKKAGILESRRPPAAAAAPRPTPVSPPQPTAPMLAVVPEPDEIDALDRVDLSARIDVEMDLRGRTPAIDFVKALGHKSRQHCTDEQLRQLLRYMRGLLLTAAAQQLPY